MIREFSRKDVVPLLKSVKQFDYSGFEKAGVEVNPGIFVGNVANMARSPASVVYVAEEDDKLVGIIGANLLPVFYSDQNAALVLFWDVLQDYRGKIGLKLFRKVETWADGKAQFVLASNVKGHGPDLDKVYKRMGYDILETQYRKEL